MAEGYEVKELGEFDLSYLDGVDLDDFEKVGLVECPWEGQLQITEKITQQGRNMRTIRFNLMPLGVPNVVATIRYDLWFPQDDDEPSKIANKLERIQLFCQAYEISDIRDMTSHVGKIANGVLKTEVLERQDGSEYEVNQVSRFVN